MQNNIELLPTKVVTHNQPKTILLHNLRTGVLFKAYDRLYRKLSKKDLAVNPITTGEEMVLDLKDWSVTTMTGDTHVIGYNSTLTVEDNV